MSLIFAIGSRSFSDLINEGARATVTGTVSGPVTDEVLMSMPDNRFAIVTGYMLTSTTITPQVVTCGMRGGSPIDTLDFFEGAVGASSPVDHSYSLGDWRYFPLGYDLVITVPNGLEVSYTIDLRVSSSPEALNYIQQIGSKEHANPYFGPESGRDRGQMEL